MRTRDSLYFRYAYNDLRKDKGVTLTLTVVLTLSVFLMAAGAMVMERTVGAVDRLFEQAEPPHSLQMHRGDHAPGALARFAAEQPGIDSGPRSAGRWRAGRRCCSPTSPRAR